MKNIFLWRSPKFDAHVLKEAISPGEMEDAVLKKTGKLSKEEVEIMKSHVRKGREIVAPTISLPEPFPNGARCRGSTGESSRSGTSLFSFYELYEKGGRRYGHDLEDWLEAEQLVLSKKGKKKLVSIPSTK